MAEAFVTKLFALSYGFSSVDVHSACGVSDFVHRFTHRATRGLIMVVGRPGKKANFITSMKHGSILG